MARVFPALFVLMSAATASFGAPAASPTTPEVKTTSTTVKVDPVRVRQLAVTRAYFKLCQRVVTKDLPPRKLPDPPGVYNEEDLTPAERKIVEKAAKMHAKSLIIPKNKLK